MKQSSTEPQKKKLVQARLPFQILSPEVKKLETTPFDIRKRKASETQNEDARVCGVTDVKENQAAPVEKKPKIVKSNTVKDVEEEKVTQNCKKDENKEEEMEVEKEAKSEGRKTLNSHTPASRGKRKTAKSQNSKQKSKKLNHIGKALDKLNDNKRKESINKSRCSESVVIDIVDLCDSPNKNANSSEKPSHEGNISKFNIESNKSKKEEQEDKLNNKIVDDSNKEQAERKEEQLVIEKSECSNSKDEVDSEENTLATKTEQSDSTIKTDNSNSEQSETLNDELKSDLEECLIKQPSLEDKVTNDCLEKKCDKTPPKLKVEVSSNISSDTSKNEKDLNISSLEPKTPLSQSRSSLDDLVSSLNESVTSCDLSLSSDCTTPNAISDTPKPLKKRASNTPRRLTPKQLMKMKEKEGRLKEKERQKQEKEKKKAEEKEEKQKLKQEKEEERLRQKQEKEEEKRKEKEEKQKEKEEKERKKQAEIAQKNEEKRLKEEEKRLKEEEKRAKEEEKKKKEEEERKKKEEKRLKEEQKEAEKRKSAQAFASFFVKSDTKPGNGDEDNESILECSKFQPFEVKNDMRLAPLVRCQLTEDRKQILDSLFDGSLSKCAETQYLKDLRDSSYIKGEAGKTWPAPDVMDDDVIIIESEKPDEEMETDSKENEKKSEKKRQRAKLLQFHENRRPPYWGTWRKKSKFIRPRAPLNEDKTMFEYDIDSDDEWEEPEDGESLRGSENEESQDEQYEEDNDMFVPHGYLSDEEGQDDLDDKSPEAMKAKLKFLQLEFEAERNEKQEKLKPRLIGCVWFSNSDTEPTVGSHIAELFLSRRTVWDGSLPVKMATPTPTSPPTPETGENEESRGAKRKLVPESLIPKMIQSLHGSRKKLTKIMADFLESCEADQRPSKRCFVDKAREIASWTNIPESGLKHWYVKDEVRQAYNLMDINISPPPPQHVPTTPNANITKFTKVLTSDERLRLLSSSKESAKPSTPSIKQSTVSVKNVNPKLPTSAKATPVVKKRIPFVTVGPVQSANSLRNFVSVRSEGKPETPNSQINDAAKNKDKAIKRITPITLTSAVTKPPPPSQEECIVVSD